MKFPILNQPVKYSDVIYESLDHLLTPDGNKISAILIKCNNIISYCNGRNLKINTSSLLKEIINQTFN
jgi:hypothetical protein